MRKRFLSFILVVVMMPATSGVVIAASASANPYAPTHSHGVASSWTLSWGNTAPYSVFFYYGDGAKWSYLGNATGASRSHTFWPCTQTTFQQHLTVLDGHNGVADDFSYATEYGGNPC